MVTEYTYGSVVFEIFRNIITICVFIEQELIEILYKIYKYDIYCDLRNNSACLNTVLLFHCSINQNIQFVVVAISLPSCVVQEKKNN